MTVVLVAAGVALVAITAVDIAWTTVAAGSGAGPVTGRVASTTWRLALRLHGRRASHRTLSVGGVSTVFTVLLTWIALAFTGWLLVFASADGAVRVATTGEPADLVGRIYFTGFTVFTLGVGDLVPGDGSWRVATVLATGTGLVLVTLSITYLVPVASAVANRRHIASYIASLGGDPHEILLRSWTGQGFGSLPQHLVSLASALHGSLQQHLAYPVLHYFHSGDERSSASVNVTNLSQALHLLRHGVHPSCRPDPSALAVLDDALGTFLGTLHGAYISAADRPLPAPPLEPLRRAGVPVVADEAYDGAGPATEHRRALLAALLADDGWPSPVSG